MKLIDEEVITSIMERLQSLEDQPTAVNPAVVTLQQQMEYLKQAIVKSKTASTNSNKDCKNQISSIKNELLTVEGKIDSMQSLISFNFIITI